MKKIHGVIRTGTSQHGGKRMKIVTEDVIYEIQGTYHIQVWRDGKLKEERIVPNIVTTVGKQLVLNLLGRKTAITGLEVIGIGTDSTTEVVGNTTLGTEVTRENITYTSTITGSGVAMTFSAFFEADDPGVTYDIAEVGMFGNGATLTANSGTLFSRKTFTAVEKETGIDTLTVDYSLSF